MIFKLLATYVPTLFTSSLVPSLHSQLLDSLEVETGNKDSSHQVCTCCVLVVGKKIGWFWSCRSEELHLWMSLSLLTDLAVQLLADCMHELVLLPYVQSSYFPFRESF